MGRRKIEIRAIKDDRNRSVSVAFTLGCAVLLTSHQHVPQAERRSLQKGARVVGVVLSRRRCDYLWTQQEVVRVLLGRHSRDATEIPIRMSSKVRRSAVD